MAELTKDELQAIRDYHNERNRNWWHKQSPEERRARRQRYALNAIRRKKDQEIKTGRQIRNLTRANGY